jgi:hypothetical protein
MATKDTSTVLAAAAAAAVLALAAATAPAQSLGTFTGGDVGEGLDLDGNFLYAVNVLGPAAGQVRDANFTGEPAGVTFGNWNAQIPNWIDTEYGDSPADNALEEAMDSIRHVGAQDGVGTIALAGLTPGTQYQLQLLFQEGCCDRGFDVLVEGVTAVENFDTGEITNTAGTYIRRTFTAGDDTLNIELNGPGGAGTFADRNPIINALTLEIIPEPASLGLLTLAGVGLLARRRR